MPLPSTAGPRYWVGRQYSLDVLLDYGTGANDIADGVIVNLPPNSVLLSGAVNVQTVFGGTSPKLTAVDSSVSPLSLFGNVAADAVAITSALTAGTDVFYPFGTTITVKVAGGTVTAGLAYVRFSYIIFGRENEVYPVGAYP